MLNKKDIEKFCEVVNKLIIPGDHARVDIKWWERPYCPFPSHIDKKDFTVKDALSGLVTLLEWTQDEYWKYDTKVSVNINGRRLRTTSLEEDEDCYWMDLDTGVLYGKIDYELITPMNDEEFLNEPFIW